MRNEFENRNSDSKKGCAILGPSWTSLPFKQNEEEPACKMLKLILSSMISDLVSQGIRDFYTTCEYGTPLWAGEIVMNMNRFSPCRLHIIMPYEEQATDWPESVRDRFFELHAKAEDVIIIEGRKSENNAFLCVERMLESCDIFLCAAGDRKKYNLNASSVKVYEYI